MPKWPWSYAPAAVFVLLLIAASALAGDDEEALPGYCAMARIDDAAGLELAGGHADLVRGVAFTTRTPMPVGSVSKTLIGVALAQLARDGQLDLDAPLEAALGWPVENPAHPGRPVTLRQLATHSSGMYDDETDYRAAYVPLATQPMALEAYLKAYLGAGSDTRRPNRFREWAPGTRYEYSNIGAALAALAVEQQTGMAFADYVRSRILQPLGMDDSGYPGFAHGPAAVPRATLYEGGDPVPPYQLVTYPDGGLVSTCSDMQRFAEAVLKARLGAPSSLDPAVVALMLEPQWTKPLRGAPARVENHGLFWEMRASGSIGHTGGDPGLTTVLAIDPSLRLARVQLTNTGLDDNAAAVAEFKSLWSALEEDAPRAHASADHAD
ncbi:serine hydrolase domain-containing protein [Lysobacter sp. A3-1-A15]|uniref:serine hydrolase domain-containing protein n=1 Tax=Novilysobacter viscosus TaxID=3098602 RepID=UPI002ED7F645